MMMDKDQGNGRNKGDNRFIVWNVRRSDLDNYYIHLMDMVAKQKPSILIIIKAPRVMSCINNTICKWALRVSR